MLSNCRAVTLSVLALNAPHHDSPFRSHDHLVAQYALLFAELLQPLPLLPAS